jgi:methylated-DNA-protein-cysteine methyltransferase-like protein
VVVRIAPGMVATYGDITAIVGLEGAREVGNALRELPAGSDLPWQRVLSRDGTISTRGLRQRELLEAEGVAFDAASRAILARHRWPGPAAEWAAAHGCRTLPPRDEGDRSEQLGLF